MSRGSLVVFCRSSRARYCPSQACRACAEQHLRYQGAEQRRVRGNEEWTPGKQTPYCLRCCRAPSSKAHNETESQVCQGQLLSVQAPNDVELTADKMVLSTSCAAKMFRRRFPPRLQRRQLVDWSEELAVRHVRAGPRDASSSTIFDEIPPSAIRGVAVTTETREATRYNSRRRRYMVGAV